MADGVVNAGWKLEGPSGGASSGGVGTISGLGGRLWWIIGDEETGMFRGDRSKTATGGDGDDTALCAMAPCDTVPCVSELCDTELCAGGGDFTMKPFVRAQAADAVATGTVSSSDSVKSITLMSLPLTVHVAGAAAAAAAAAVVVVVVVVVVAVGATDRTLCGVSTTFT